MWEREFHDRLQLYSYDNGLYMYTVLLVHVSVTISAFCFTASSIHTTAYIKFMHESDISVMTLIYVAV